MRDPSAASQAERAAGVAIDAARDAALRAREAHLQRREEELAEQRRVLAEQARLLRDTRAESPTDTPTGGAAPWPPVAPQSTPRMPPPRVRRGCGAGPDQPAAARGRAVHAAGARTTQRLLGSCAPGACRRPDRSRGTILRHALTEDLD